MTPFLDFTPTVLYFHHTDMLIDSETCKLITCIFLIKINIELTLLGHSDEMDPPITKERVGYQPFYFFLYPYHGMYARCNSCDTVNVKSVWQLM